MNDKCPECGARLECDEVDIGVGVLKGPPHCDDCLWYPGAVKVPCECGCGKMSFDKRVEFNHFEDYIGERG